MVTPIAQAWAAVRRKPVRRLMITSTETMLEERSARSSTSEGSSSAACPAARSATSAASSPEGMADTAVTSAGASRRISEARTRASSSEVTAGAESSPTSRRERSAAMTNMAVVSGENEAGIDPRPGAAAGVAKPAVSASSVRQ